MKLETRYEIEYVIDGSVLEGEITKRQYGLADAQVVMRFETTMPLHLAVMPDIVQYRYDNRSLQLVIPLLSAEEIDTPIRLAEHPRLLEACRTGEIKVRVETPTEGRVFHATSSDSERWLSDDPGQWEPPGDRLRLLIQLGVDGAPNAHPAAFKVRSVAEAADGEMVIPLQDLVLTARSTCIYCDDTDPDTREHVLPSWATPSGATGITTACCGPCNHRLSGLEEIVSKISRRKDPDLSLADRTAVGLWAVKTIWAVGTALGIDSLRGAGDSTVSDLIGRAGTDGEPRDFEIADVYSSVEEPGSISFVRCSTDESDRPWVMLRVLNLVTSIWLKPVSDSEHSNAPATQ